eukprot:scaffold247712_cov17-Tisochrysis_lutea.AAC.1
MHSDSALAGAGSKTRCRPFFARNCILGSQQPQWQVLCEYNVQVDEGERGATVTMGHGFDRDEKLCIVFVPRHAVSGWLKHSGGVSMSSGSASKISTNSGG